MPRELLDRDLYAQASNPQILLTSRTFRFELPEAELDRVLLGLEKYQQREPRRWLTLSSPHIPDDGSPARITFTLEDPPAYEAGIEGQYVRGTVLRVHVGPHSGNILMSHAGAQLAAETLREARQRMDSYLLIEARAPAGRRRDHLLHVQADRDLLADRADTEHDRLARTAEAEAAFVLPADDFADWE